MRVVSGTLRELDDDEREKYSPYKYVTLSEYIYEHENKQVIVKEGFLTDGSSGGPDYGSSWIFHDYLYATHQFTEGGECTRHEADKVMERVLTSERLGWYTWLFVKTSYLNPFWLFSKAWETSGRRGPEYLDSQLN